MTVNHLHKYKLIIIGSCILALTSCGLAKQQQWRQAEAKASEEWQKCLAKFSSGEYDYIRYADCNDVNAVTVLDAAQHPNANGARQVNAFRRLLGEQIKTGKLTKAQAAMLEMEYINRLASMEMQAQQMNTQAAAAQNQAMQNFGLQLMQASQPKPSVNCNTHYLANGASTTCY